MLLNSNRTIARSGRLSPLDLADALVLGTLTEPLQHVLSLLIADFFFFFCSLAYLNMRLIMTRILWNFDLEAQPDNIDPHETTEFGVWQGQIPQNVRLTDIRA